MSTVRLPLRFRLSSLMIVVTVLSILLGRWVYLADQQEKMVKAVHAIGGSVTYAHEIRDDGVQIATPTLPGPSWLRNLIGERYFVTVTKIAFDNPTDEKLAKLAELKLPSVEHLLAVSGPLTDAGLRSLNRRTFPNLRRLRIDETQITDAGLAYLKDLPKLEKLYLSSTNITNEGMRHVAEMKKLVSLDLFQTGVDRTGVEILKEKLPDLTIINPPSK